MATERHKNYKKASNILVLAAILLFIKLFFNQSEFVFGTTDSRVVETFQRLAMYVIGFMLLLGILVRFGMGWIKFLLAVMICWDFLSVPGMLLSLTSKPITNAIYLAVFGLQIWAMVLLFQIQKSPRPVEAVNPITPSPNVRANEN